MEIAPFGAEIVGMSWDKYIYNTHKHTATHTHTHTHTDMTKTLALPHTQVNFRQILHV